MRVIKEYNIIKKISMDTIAAISTGRGGATAVVRISGSKAIEIADKIFITKKLSDEKGFTLHYGEIVSKSGEVIDDVLLSLFRAPHSYSGEDMVEISVHGSDYILSALLKSILSKGGRMAEAGEFTMRAYCNGKMDLVQAEAVADIISSSTAASHRLAINQMRGGYSSEFMILRKQLLNIMSLIELELDFGEEDVEFADRSKLMSLLDEIRVKIDSLVSSFSQGNAIKKGVPVAIVGRPNAGKSTLLNALLRDDRAIVSDIAGTTRDVIEERMILSGVEYRFIDTAGIRETKDELESMGIERTMRVIDSADMILLVLDGGDSADDLRKQISGIKIKSYQKMILVLNKSDISDLSIKRESIRGLYDIVEVSAKQGIGIKDLEGRIVSLYGSGEIGEDSVIISNMRHFELLSRAKESIERVISGLNGGLPTDLLSQELRESTYYIGSLTGEITTDEILGNIFKNFCIGK